MGYPDSFGQRRKKLDIEVIYNIFQSQSNRSNGYGDIATQICFLIRAYRKSHNGDVSQSLICTASK